MTSNTSPTVVLVHGAFAESASWNRVISRLDSNGVTAIAVANPLRGVHSDAAYLASTLASIEGPLVLVGHSYGGMLITEAGAANSNVIGLVYVAAFAPDAGETALDLTGRFPGSSLSETIHTIDLGDGSADLYIDQDKYHEQFMGDVAVDEAQQAAVAQRPITDKALSEGLSGAPAWRSIPSWFVFGDLDRNIPVEAHRSMAVRAEARESVEVTGASHSVGVSQSETVAAVILHALQGAGA